MQKSDNLWIVADDLGLDEYLDEGIFFAAKNNLIDGVSIVAGSSAFDNAVRKLKEYPNLAVGIHLALVEEKSVLDKNSVQSLINKDGFFHKNHQIFFVRYCLGLIRKEEIKKEFEAQIERCLAAGLKIEFINSHQHLHLLPGIRDIAIELAKKYGIQLIRTVNEPLTVKGNLFRKGQLIFLRFLSNRARDKIKASHLKSNDFFVGFINAGKLSEPDIIIAQKLSQENPEKLIELGCHPGFENEYVRARYKSWGGYNWQNEIKSLKNVLFNEGHFS